MFGVCNFFQLFGKHPENQTLLRLLITITLDGRKSVLRNLRKSMWMHLIVYTMQSELIEGVAYIL